MSSAPLLNPERESNKKKLQDKLKDAQSARRIQVDEDDKKGSSTNSSNSNSRPKSQAKKPVPNFGGGRLGSS